MPSVISAGTTAGTAIAITGDTTGNLAFQTNGTTTAMTIDTSQNVLIGATTFDNGGFAGGANGLNVVDATHPIVLIKESTTGTKAFFGASSTLSYLWTPSNIPLAFGTNDTERGRFDTSGNFLFNSGYGSVATAYGCRAWVNFNGSGGASIRASGNISSVTRNSTGDYTVSFTNAMPDTNYAVIMYNNCSTANPPDPTSFANQYTGGIGSIATGSVRVTSYSTTWADSTLFNIAIFR